MPSTWLERLEGTCAGLATGGKYLEGTRKEHSRGRRKKRKGWRGPAARELHVAAWGAGHKDDRLCMWERDLYRALERSVLG